MWLPARLALSETLMFTAILLGPLAAQAQTLHLNRDLIDREKTITSTLRGDPHEFHFDGFRPSELESSGDAAKFAGTAELGYLDMREDRRPYPVMGSAKYPVAFQSLLMGEQGFDPAKGDSAFAAISATATANSHVLGRAEVIGGANPQYGSWYHLPQAFLEFRLGKAILSVGRKPLRWGQSFIAPLLISDHATPFDSVQLTTLPLELPWIFSVLGPIKVEAFLSRMNADRDNEHDWFYGWRMGFKPSAWFEVNLASVSQAGGKGVGTEGGFTTGLVEFFGARTAVGPGGLDTSNFSNRAIAMDGRISLRPLGVSASIYTEQHLEDCCGFTKFFERPYSFLYGVDALLSSSERPIHLSAEYVRTASMLYYHLTWTSGFSNDGNVLGHPLGRDAQGLYIKLEKPLDPHRTMDVMSFWEQRERMGLVDVAPVSMFDPRITTAENRWGALGGIRWEFGDKLLTVSGRLGAVWAQNYRGYSGLDRWGHAEILSVLKDF